jgi:hypothetical protein
MAQAKLYQRLRTKGFNWAMCPIAKNGTPKPSPDASCFGVRYTPDEAVAYWRSLNVQFYAARNGAGCIEEMRIIDAERREFRPNVSVTVSSNEAQHIPT